jgi:hypothetical protein
MVGRALLRAFRQGKKETMLGSQEEHPGPIMAKEKGAFEEGPGGEG